MADFSFLCRLITRPLAAGLGSRPAEMDTTHFRQTVEDLRLELASLVCRVCGYPIRAILSDSKARDTVSAVMSRIKRFPASE
jgi:hypothetical protein